MIRKEVIRRKTTPMEVLRDSTGESHLYLGG